MGNCSHPMVTRSGDSWVCSECGAFVRSVDPWEK